MKGKNVLAIAIIVGKMLSEKKNLKFFVEQTDTRRLMLKGTNTWHINESEISYLHYLRIPLFSLPESRCRFYRLRPHRKFVFFVFLRLPGGTWLQKMTKRVLSVEEKNGALRLASTYGTSPLLCVI